MVSYNKQLANPSSTDSIVSSNGQEDHVSMGANAAVQALILVNNVERILSIELLNASQAIHFRKPLKTSDFLEEFLDYYQESVPFVSDDRQLNLDIKASIEFVQSMNIETGLLSNFLTDNLIN